MITVVYRCPSCRSRWVDPREGLGGSQARTSPATHAPRLEDRLCRACERAEERSLWQRAGSAARVSGKEGD